MTIDTILRPAETARKTEAAAIPICPGCNEPCITIAEDQPLNGLCLGCRQPGISMGARAFWFAFRILASADDPSKAA